MAAIHFHSLYKQKVLASESSYIVKEEMPLPSGVRCGLRKDEARPLVGVSVLTLIVGWQEGGLIHKKPCSTNFPRFCFGTSGGGRPEENWLTLVHLGKWPLS